MNLGIIIDTQSFRAKIKLLGRRKGVHESFSSRQKSRKSFTLTVRGNVANPVKIYHGITERPLLIDLRQMAFLRQQYEESKKEHQQYCYNRAWMENGGLILWNAIAFCETSTTSWPTGKLLTKGDSENHSRVQWYLLEQWLNIIRFLQETSQGSTNLVRKCYRGTWANRWGIWKWDILVADLEELGQMDASEIHPRRINAKEVWTPQKGDVFIFPIADCTAKLSGRDQEFWEPTLRRKKKRMERRPQWRASRRMGRFSTDRNKLNMKFRTSRHRETVARCWVKCWARWCWSPERFLVDPRWLPSIAITLNLEFSYMCSRKKHSLFHWNSLTIIGMSMWTKVYQILVQDSRHSR